MTELHAPMQQSKLQNYNSVRGASAYKSDYDKKFHRKLSDRRERSLLTRYFRELERLEISIDTVLDVPCGHGRLSDFLKSRCRRLLEADWSMTMVQLNRQDHEPHGRGYLRCSALQIPLPDRAIDLTVSFRLSHHLQTQQLREQHLREVFRVSDKAVIVTWFSATSLKNRLRNLRSALGTKRRKNVLHSSTVTEIAEECGFGQHLVKPLFLVGSGHVLGLFTRRS